MDGKIPPPNEPVPMQELGEALRPAVEQVRAAAPPADAVGRAVERAQRLGPPVRRRPRRRLVGVAVAAGIAAVLLVGYQLWPGRVQHQAGPQLAYEMSPEEEAAPERRTDEKKSERPTSDKAAPDAAEDMRELTKREATLRDARSNSITTTESKDAPSNFNLDSRDSLLPAPKRPAPGMTGPGGPAPAASPPAPPGSGGGLGGSGQRRGSGPVPTGAAPADSLPRKADDAAPLERQMNRARGEGAGRALDEGRKDRSGSRASTWGKDGKGASPEPSDEKAAERKGDADAKPRREEREHLRKRLEEAERDVTVLKQNVDRLEEQSRRAVVEKEVLQRAKKDLQLAEETFKSVQAQAKNVALVGGKKEDKGPRVWHRDRSRPTFARVYIGDGNALDLVSLRVTVTVEGPRARTVVDHVFRNPHDRQLEGTFEYPLPSGASPSYFAMFLGQTRDTAPALFRRGGENAALPTDALARLTPAELVRQVDTADWGRLQEARVVSKEKALETYEEIVRGRIDPALLEYSGGNTFSGRVFPIPAKGYNRVVLAYEETLPVAREHMVYRFPLPGRKLNELQFTLQAKADECLKPSLMPKDAQKEEANGRVTFSRTWKDEKPEGEVVFACEPADPQVQAVSGRQGDNGPLYLYARLRPQLKEVARGGASATHAVFLLDTSLSEYPQRFDVNVRLLRKILESDTDIKQFNVLTFNVGAAWLDEKGWFDNTAAGRDKALAKLDGIVLEGATDVSAALNSLARPAPGLAAGTALDVFLLSDGHVTWGEPDVAALVARFEHDCPYPTRFHCYRTGLGEENAELFDGLTRKGGGVFQCYGEADLDAAAKAHKGECLRVDRVRFVGGPEASDVLVAGRRAAVYPGGDLLVAGRFGAAGRTTVVVEGEFAGKKMVQEFPVEIKSAGELAPRAWAEVAVASLLALHDDRLDSLVTAYCQQFGIVSRVASFLVLENEADYKRLNLEEERGKTLAGDLGHFVADQWARLGKAVPAGKEFERFLNQANRRVNLLGGPQGAHVKQMLALLKDADFELPVSPVAGGLVKAKDVANYLAERERGEDGRRDVAVYLREARRRADAGDTDGAVRVLSSIIEEYPSRGDALRLVGYRLVDLKQPAQAARLFGQVQRQRPFEPHSYRDLAHALEESGKYGLAAVNYEAVLAGNWHARFREELKLVCQEEYAHMMQEAIRQKRVSPSLANHFGERLEQMARPQPKSDLRVTISWNTDATDIDLWVIEPDGTKCFYSHNRTANGGELSQDQTQGYGPERYQIAKARPGVYTVIVHYFRPNPNLLGGETHVNVRVTRFAGSPQETTERHTVILKKHDEQVEVCKVKF